MKKPLHVRRARPQYPDEVLKEGMDERELSTNRLAQALGVPVTRIHAIVNGRRGISAICRLG